MNHPFILGDGEYALAVQQEGPGQPPPHRPESPQLRSPADIFAGPHEWLQYLME